MAYLEIEDYPVFINRDRQLFLSHELIDDASERVATEIKGKARDKFWTDSVEYLKEKKENSKQEFEENWYNFKFLNEKASQNLYDVLSSYSHFHGYSYIEDVLSSQEKNIYQKIGHKLNFPLKNAFYFCVQKQSNFFENFFKSPKVKSKILINSNSVRKIEGNLKTLTIHMDGFLLYLSDEIQIISIKDIELC